MPNKPAAFGRRRNGARFESHTDDGQQQEKLASESGRVETNILLQGIEARGGRILLIGELVAFVGLLVVILVTSTWPSNPGNLPFLGDRIFVPETLLNLVPFDRPAIQSHYYSQGIRLIDASLGIFLFAGVGFLAILRRRWLLAGLAAAFFVFPFSVFGLYVPRSTVFFLTLFLIAAVLRCVRIRLFAKVGIAVFTLMLTPMVTSILSGILPDFDPRTERYAAVRFSALSENASKPRVISSGRYEGKIRGTSFVQLPAATSEQMAARAFVLAQEKAQRGDAAAAETYLAEARAAAFPRTQFERQVTDDLRNFIVASGEKGPAAQAESLRRFKVAEAVAWVALVLGILAALLGPASDVLHTAIANRLRRMRHTEEHLRKVTAASGMPAGVEANFDSVPSAHAAEAVEAIGKRTTVYWISSAACTWVALYCFAGYLRFRLPDANANTAFDTIAAPARSLTFLREAGLTMNGSEIAAMIRSMVDLQAVFALGILFALFVRPLRVYALAALLVIVLFVPSRHMAPQRVAAYPIEVGELTQLVRDELKESVTTDDERIDRSLGAYLLAQVAYIEGRPNDAADNLARVTDTRMLSSMIHQQRMSVMREWVAADSHLLPPQAAAPRLPLSLERMRRVAAVFSYVALFAAAFGTIMATLAFLGGRRRRRLEAMQPALQSGTFNHVSDAHTV